MVHPTEVQKTCNYNQKKRLTGTFTLTGNCGVPRRLANLDPPPDNEKAPASAATEAGARTNSKAATGHSNITDSEADPQYLPHLIERHIGADWLIAFCNGRAAQ